MSRFALRALLLVAALLPVCARATAPGYLCLEAGVVAERNWTLPPDLIHAIGRVESGRPDKMTGHVSAWPWTVNANGSGFWFASRAEAVVFVRTLQSLGVRLIDVGCFQIDLFYHPEAFSSLEQAFDPAANANYAGRFLTELRNRTGSWTAAIAGYHSGRAIGGESYRQKVAAQWRSGSVFTGATLPTADAGARAVAAVPDRFVVLMSAAARAIPIFRP
jgi:soluble lytic murein transglycosylase-like protein